MVTGNPEKAALTNMLSFPPVSKATFSNRFLTALPSEWSQYIFTAFPPRLFISEHANKRKNVIRIKL